MPVCSALSHSVSQSWGLQSMGAASPFVQIAVVRQKTIQTYKNDIPVDQQIHHRQETVGTTLLCVECTQMYNK